MEEIKLAWTEAALDKICTKHGVTAEEVDEAVYEDKPLLRKGPGTGENRRY